MEIGGSNLGWVKSKTDKWHMLLFWLALIIKGLEQGWCAHCQFNVTRWGTMFVCGIYFGVLA